MQPIYRWHGTPERTGSLFFAPMSRPTDAYSLFCVFYRAAKDGWTERAGHAYWTLSDHVTTDLEMLMAAVTTGDEPVAARIASRLRTRPSPMWES